MHTEGNRIRYLLAMVWTLTLAAIAANADPLHHITQAVHRHTTQPSSSGNLKGLDSLIKDLDSSLSHCGHKASCVNSPEWLVAHGFQFRHVSLKVEENGKVSLGYCVFHGDRC